MASHELNGRVLDARPDRIDFRDKPYNPPLASLPPTYPSPEEIARFLPEYHRTSKILDQGSEGACTGFGLAAVVNYITWEHWMRGGQIGNAPEHVSPYMFYDNARAYDEWEGEDYSGSSCRGAMKGWHKHGVCRHDLWKRRTRGSPRPNPEWQVEAASRPLGAYYRVDAHSIVEMQAAIKEVHAVYCSARVHSGWQLSDATPHIPIAGLMLPVIEFNPTPRGGHAFALVGYTEDGFIVQNSWGVKWGLKGFALLSYEDWVVNGDDAWVAAMAAPTRVRRGEETPLVPAGRSGSSMQSTTTASPGQFTKGAKTWTQTEAYEHCVVMGNDGKLLRRLVDTADAADNLRKVAVDLPSASLAATNRKHVLLFAHGGLNSEEAAIERAMRLGPWFDTNGIYPIFIVWRTSLMESIGQIGADLASEFVAQSEELRARGLGDVFDNAVAKLQDKFDKAFEAAAEKVMGKAVWSQLKQNAAAAADRSGGTRQLLKALRKLREKRPQMSLHMIGHSAGAILLGHMLDDFGANSGLATVNLYAPACTMEFATRHYVKALDAGIIGRGKLHVDNLSDRNERSDTVVAYGKSLLYLVSRAFEDPRNMPLLGFERCWVKADEPEDQLRKRLRADFAEDQMHHLCRWASACDRHAIGSTANDEPQILTKVHEPPRQGEVRIKAAHGSFDNDINVVSKSIARIVGSPAPDVPITDLSGF